MAILTKRERVMRTVRFQETDRVPVYDILQNDAVIEHYGGEPLTVENGDRVKSVAVGRTLDMTRMPTGPDAPRTERNDDGFLIQYERWTSWIIERPFHDMPTAVEWIKGQIKKSEAQVYDATYGERFHRYIQGWLDQYAAADAAASTAAYPTGRGDPTVMVIESGVGLTEMYWMIGMELFAYLCADEPGLIEEWLDARNRAELRRVAAIADPRLIPIALTYDDIAYKNAPLFSPAWLRRLWAPRLKRLNAAWHDRDTVCLFHSDGNLFPVLDDLVAAGIDGLNPLEVLAGMSVGKVRERYPHLFLTGGIDVSQLLPFGTPEEVAAACRQAIAEASGRGYFLGSTTELHWDVKLENAVAMFETAWNSKL